VGASPSRGRPPLAASFDVGQGSEGSIAKQEQVQQWLLRDRSEGKRIAVIALGDNWVSPRQAIKILYDLLAMSGPDRVAGYAR
jgi:hypothetical protein